MNNFFLYLTIILSFLSVITNGQILMEKTVNARQPINETCLEVLRGKNMTLMQRCEFFKCFEER